MSGLGGQRSEVAEPVPALSPAPATELAEPASPAGGRLNTRAVLALQRSAGNAAVSRLMGQAMLQRCGGPPGSCSCETCAEEADPAELARRRPQTRNAALQEVFNQAGDEFGAGTGGQAESVGGPEDEMAEVETEGDLKPEAEAPAQRLVERAIARAARRRMLARAATWSAGPVHEVNNLADCVINGTPAGVTWPTLNGTQFWSGAAAGAAIARPTLTTAAAAAGGFESSVDQIPANLGSFDETVLARGPWRLNTTKAAVTAAVPGLPAACGGAGNTRFRAYGNASDAAMFTANRRHEDHHATDHRAAYNATIAPWDAALTAAKAAGRKFNGATAAAAEAALWAAMGGTPDQVATAFFDQCQAAVIAYHGSAAGGPIGAPTNPGARNHCTISWAKYTNPS